MKQFSYKLKWFHPNKARFGSTPTPLQIKTADTRMGICCFCLWATKKIFSEVLRMNSNSYINHGESRVYHQFRRNCISSKRSFVYHQAADKCTLKRDEIQPQRGWWYAPRFARWWYAKPAAWIKKFDKLKLVEFFGYGLQKRYFYRFCVWIRTLTILA